MDRMLIEIQMRKDNDMLFKQPEKIDCNHKL